MRACDKCGKNDATIFLTQVVESDTIKVSLCATCGEPFTRSALSPEALTAWLGGGKAFETFVNEPFNKVASNDSRYTKEAFWFVRDGVNRAVRVLSRESRHVTPAELIEELRLLALERYGRSARDQLGSWGVKRCEDFGEIVFTLIEHGLFGKQPGDKKEDFESGYDFETAFHAPIPEG
jgi:uncharacterized repeat protein (TIGR04138 family)